MVTVSMCSNINSLHRRIEHLIKLANLQVMQQYVQGFLPQAFANTWVTNLERRRNESDVNVDLQRTLRNSDNIHVPFVRLSHSQKQPLVKIPKLWTLFDEPSIKIIRDRAEFKTKLKDYFVNQLSETPLCNRMLCPVCHLGV